MIDIAVGMGFKEVEVNNGSLFKYILQLIKFYRRFYQLEHTSAKSYFR